eukprot:COSAG06_NODE_2744_length_6354_cov_66.135252_4_plen_73_part_00
MVDSLVRTRGGISRRGGWTDDDHGRPASFLALLALSALLVSVRAQAPTIRSRCSHSRHSAHYHTPLWPPYVH